MRRHHYRVDRDAYRPSGRTLPADLEIRLPVVEDRMALADLMMDSYIGTIDYDGETHDQAVEEVDGALGGEALLSQSLLAVRDGVIQSAVLVNKANKDAFIGYVMTRAAVKGEGLASALLDLSAEAIWKAGYERITAWITEGNGPSEAIFLRAGFEVIGTWDSEKQE
ncbi:MAG: GNAT family N-acetyltransferase [Acidimicrobiia bacterium]